MRRRDPDPRPTVELWGTEASPVEGTTTIEVGGRRSRRAPLLAVVAAVAVLAGGIALGGGDDEQAGFPPREERDNRKRDDLKPPPVGGVTSTTRPSTATTAPTTTTTYVPAPVLPVSTGAAVLLADSTSTWTWVDLDSGERIDVQVGTTDPYGVVAVSGGVVGLTSGSAQYHPLPLGIPVALGPADSILASGSPDAVWLIRTTFDGPTMVGAEAVLVDLQGNERHGPIAVPAAYPIGGTDEGLVFSRGGRTYLADESGVRPLALGEALRTNRTSVVVLACDDRAECAPEIVDIATGAVRRLAPVPNPYEMGISVLLSDEGDLAIVSYRGDGQALQVYGAAGQIVAEIDVTSQSEPRWLPAGMGLVAPANDGSGVVRLSLIEGGGVLAEPVVAFAGEYGDFLYVIPR